MSFTQMYKPGQGKWARLVTGGGIALIVLFGLAWLLGELEGVMGARPQISTVAPDGQVEGQTFTVTLSYTDRKNDEDVLAKSAVSYTAEKGEKLADVLRGLERGIADRGGTVWKRVSVKTDETEGKLRIVGNTAGLPFDVESAATGSASMSAAVASQARTGDATIMKGIVALVVIAGFGVLAWWLLNKPNIVEFMIATESEMRKVNWPTRKEITGSTWVVIVGTFLVAFLLFAVDLGFTWFFTFIKIIDISFDNTTL